MILHDLSAVHGAGLGLRRALMSSFALSDKAPVDFLELAPENWIRMGGKSRRELSAIAEKYPIVAHGLSLSIGAPHLLDFDFLAELKLFLNRYSIGIYSEHLSYCGDHGHLYDLMPIPFTDDSVKYVAARLRQVQDFLGRKIAIENVSYYCAPGQEMDEITFLNAILEEADCFLLLDVNNIYVNSINHQYDALEFIRKIPTDRIIYIHIAGHANEAENLIIDSHGADVINPVWDLLRYTYQFHGVYPTLLERDFNLPPFDVLLKEVEKIKMIQGMVNRDASSSVLKSKKNSADYNLAVGG